MTAATHDAIVIGAGPAGSVAAMLLARAGWAVALVEKASFPRRKVCGEFLSPTNQPLFAQLGLGADIARLAGPAVTRMALYAGNAAIEAPLPHPRAELATHGHAIGREYLDTLLRDHAVAAGAELFQPWSARLESPDPDAPHTVTLSHAGQAHKLSAPIIIEAQGAWGKPGRAPRPHDLMGFKAHFRGGRLPPDLMPLLVFPGGYGGLVTSSDGHMSFGCAVTRATLARIHTPASGPPAQAVLAYVLRHCRAAAAMLQGAEIEGSWLGAGPIRPQLRNPCGQSGIFRVGNAAGEAHSLVGEGMSMAMQGAWLLASLLTRAPSARAGHDLDAIGQAYRRAWRAAFLPRIATAWLYAEGAMRRAPVAASLPLFRAFPSLLTRAAALSGKTHLVRI